MNLKLILLIALLLFACKKKESDIYFESKDLLLLKLIPYDFKNLKLNEKLYIYYLSLAFNFIENIRIDQLKYNSSDLFIFITELYENNKYLDKNLRDKISNLYLKFKTFNSTYYNFKKINSNLTYEELNLACDVYLKKELDFNCHNKLNLNKVFLFDNTYEAVLLSKYSYDPIKYSLVNFNSNDLSLFNLNTIKLNKNDAYSYFSKTKEGKVINLSFCEKYKDAIEGIILNLNQAISYSNANNKLILELLINFFKSCEHQDFLDYNLVWSYENISFLAGFIEKQYDPIATRGLIASLILKNINHKEPYILYQAVGFNNNNDYQNILLPVENAMNNYNNNRLINPINVFNPINKYFRSYVLNNFYPKDYRKDLKEQAVVFRTKIEEIKNNYLNNINLDKKSNKDINLDFPYLNEVMAYLYALTFLLENPSFNYLNINNINKLILIDFFTEALLLESAFNNFNTSISILLNNFIDEINFIYEDNIYFIDIDETLFFKKAKELFNQIQLLVYLNKNELTMFYKNFSELKTLDEKIINNFKNRYFASKKSPTYIKFKQPTYKLLNKNNEIVDVTYYFK